MHQARKPGNAVYAKSVTLIQRYKSPACDITSAHTYQPHRSIDPKLRPWRSNRNQPIFYAASISQQSPLNTWRQIISNKVIKISHWLGNLFFFILIKTESLFALKEILGINKFKDSKVFHYWANVQAEHQARQLNALMKCMSWGCFTCQRICSSVYPVLRFKQARRLDLSLLQIKCMLPPIKGKNGSANQM